MIGKCTACLHTSHSTRFPPVLLCVLLLIGLHGCSRLPVVQFSTGTVLHGSLSDHPIEHVVILAVDGLEQGTLIKYLTQNRPRKPGGLHDLLGVRVDANGLQLTKGIAVQQPSTVSSFLYLRSLDIDVYRCVPRRSWYYGQ